MRLFDSLFRRPLSAAKIAKVAKLAANPFAQPEVRMREMQKLLDDASPEALSGVLRRFAHNAQGHIADEDEKKWLVDALVDKGEVALAPLRRYIETESKLTYALRAYAKLSPQTAAADFMATLDRYGPQDYRAIEAKLQLVLELRDAAHSDEAVMLRLLPYLQDHADDVRYALLDLLDAQPAQRKAAATLRQPALAQLSELLGDPQTSARIARRAAEFLSDAGWSFAAEATPPMHDVLQSEFFIDKKGFVRRRVAAAAQSFSP